MARKKVKVDESYSELDMYCIWLNEYYTSLKKSGFDHSVALAIMIDKDSYPKWVSFRSAEEMLEDGEED